MTEMVFGAAPARPSEPILTRWWRTVDRWTVGAVLALIVIGLVVGMAASAPLADKLNLPTFYFVARQAGVAVGRWAGQARSCPSRGLGNGRAHAPKGGRRPRSGCRGCRWSIHRPPQRDLWAQSLRSGLPRPSLLGKESRCRVG